MMGRLLEETFGSLEQGDMELECIHIACLERFKVAAGIGSAGCVQEPI